MLLEAGIYIDIWPFYARLHSSSSVAAMGDKRDYGKHPHSPSGQVTTEVYKFYWMLMKKTASSTVNEAQGVSEVV
ncbi:hypothetical protein DL766_002195 [Monosporascus sp. MC13-8B]|uniref:GMP synthase C-terminal domain-containing protein n=1 Tax=Monosporascus cannonballus TaxID=155416 RepID=A0ABY0GRC4_9PEZI|nr:hypothetical protein DL762_010485 [Monosporascus cannonballus]RYO91684.1 hypothetical protein DL763_004917 [Monosporascus cannonballus]RYP36013.1 hypothetical protein DL766_002195 [Monosporascus sp. MC13-8B]